MNRIGLKINGIWCVLPQDVSISIEEQNPLFSDSGSFSYPIEMSVSQNRELFKSIDAVAGRTRPHHLDGLPFELWYDGVMLLYGSIETDEDLDIEEDRCTVNLVSGNGDFQSKIEGLQCTDVPLMSKVELGYSFPSIEVTYKHPLTGDVMVEDCQLNEDQLMVYKNVNVTFPYNAKNPYCNARICVEKKESYVIGKEEPYWVLDAERSFSGVCFYVAYFLDCLFSHLGVVVKRNDLQNVKDMLRLAFFTTKCDVEYGEKEEYPLSSHGNQNTWDIKDENVEFQIYKSGSGSNLLGETFKLFKRKVYATSKNFPDVAVSDVISSLFNAFGLKVAHDPKKNEVVLLFLRDIFRDNEVIDSEVLVRDKSISFSKVKGVTLSYDGSDDNTAFNYNDWKNVEPFTDYASVMQKMNPYNKTCYVSSVTGNKYRFKNNAKAEEEGNEAELYPTLFEVAQYNKFVLGEDSENNEELSIKFTPLIENAVSGDADEKLVDINPQRLAVFIPDIKMNKPQTKLGKKRTVFYYNGSIPIWDSGDHTQLDTLNIWESIQVSVKKTLNYDESEYQNSPLQEYDSGFTLGIMRGPGSEAKTEVFLPNYDGNGNDAWTTVVADYAFTADTMDAYGNRYDYNGTTGGLGYEDKDSISLKTHITTAQELGLKDEDGNPVNWGIDSTVISRGLADRFMSEYMYFLLNRKTVKMDIDTTLSHLTSLTWLKRHRIGEVVGFIKSRSYTLSNSGVSDMNIEMYTVN